MPFSLCSIDSDAAALATCVASTSDLPAASIAHSTPVCTVPADRLCTALVGNPSTCVTSPPGSRTQAPRAPARMINGARNVVPRLSHNAFISLSNVPPTVTGTSSSGAPSRLASLMAA